MNGDVVRLQECGSTMDEAKRLAHEGAPHGTVVVAQRMEAGRGQHGHKWFAPEGGLYLSVIFRDLDDPRFLTLALGNAVADVLEVAGVEPRMKWVNDVLVDDRKVAGILVEAESTGGHIDFLVAGIGINVNGARDRFPADLQPVVTTVEEELGVEQCVPDLEAFLLEEIDRWVQAVRRGATGDILRVWRGRDALKGRSVRVAESGEDVTGVAGGVDDAGHLLVETDDGPRTVAQGSTWLLDLAR